MKNVIYLLAVLMLLLVRVSVGQTAYVTSYFNNQIKIIDLITNTVVQTINTTAPVKAVSVSDDGTKVYILNYYGVYVLSTATNSIVANIPVSTTGILNGISVNHAGTRVYVTNGNDNTVRVINTATNTVIDTIGVGAHPFGVAVNQTGSYIYVTDFNSQNVTVIDASTDTVTATISVGSEPIGIAVSPNGSYVYVANSNSGNVSVISTATNSVITTIPVGTIPKGIAFLPSGNYVYVTNNGDNTVSIIYTPANTVTSTMTVGLDPFALSCTPSGSRMYVANTYDGTVSFIDTYAHTVSAPLYVCLAPQPFGNFISSHTTPVIHTSNTIDTTICEGSTFLVPFTSLATMTTGNIYTAQLSNASGSFATHINIGSITANTSGVISASIPVGTAPGTLYRIRVVSSSPVTIGTNNGFNIKINPAMSQNVSANICQGSVYTFPDGSTDSITTTHASHLSALQYCDSIIVTNLTVNPTYLSNESVNLCQGITYTFPDGSTDTVATIHTSHLNSVYGCDSTIITSLTFNSNPLYSTNESVAICQGTSYTFPDGSIDSMNTIHTSHFNSTNYCDSAIVTTLTINSVFIQSSAVSICQGSTYVFPDGSTDTIATAHTSHLSSIHSCDSTIVTTLTVNPTYSNNTTAFICHDSVYTFPDGTVDSNSVVHISHLNSNYFCDSSIVTTLTVYPGLNVNINLSYMDTICHNIGFISLTGATPPGGYYSGSGVLTNLFDTYTAGLGSHTIKYNITDGNGCINSASTNVYVDACASISEFQNPQSEISISPNPFTNSTTITLSSPINNRQLTIIITDVLGKEIKTITFTGKECVIEKGDMQRGIYFVQITDENKNVVNRKIVLQ